MEDKNKRFGWEIAHNIEVRKPRIIRRLIISKKILRNVIYALIIFIILFLIGCWLAGNPFDNTKRIDSDFIKAKGWENTNEWNILWGVVLLTLIFEFLDATAGMGFGTALAPILLLIGFNLRQIVPIILIQQATVGIIDGFLHKDFENVDWKFKPMSETVKLTILISVIGSIAILFTVTVFYGLIKTFDLWIEIYIAILLLSMGIVSFLKFNKSMDYKPKKMKFFSILAGFNKGIGGGGFGPVITVGGILSGIPAKSMLAITSLSEGFVSIFGVLAWVFMSSLGTTIDFVLLPSVMLGTIFSALAAPYVVRLLPEKSFRIVIPAYCCIISVLCFWKIIPEIIHLIA